MPHWVLAKHWNSEISSSTGTKPAKKEPSGQLLCLQVVVSFLQIVSKEKKLSQEYVLFRHDPDSCFFFFSPFQAFLLPEAAATFPLVVVQLTIYPRVRIASQLD